MTHSSSMDFLFFLLLFPRGVQDGSHSIESRKTGIVGRLEHGFRRMALGGQDD